MRLANKILKGTKNKVTLLSKAMLSQSLLYSMKNYSSGGSSTRSRIGEKMVEIREDLLRMSDSESDLEFSFQSLIPNEKELFTITEETEFISAKSDFHKPRSNFFYSPQVVGDMPEERERIMVTLEDVPELIQEEEVSEAIKRLIGTAPVRSERFSTKLKPIQHFHLLVEMPDLESKRALLSPNRLSFGIYLSGKRCDLYDTESRQKTVFLNSIPKQASKEDVSHFVEQIQQRKLNLHVTKYPRANCLHSFFFYLNFFSLFSHSLLKSFFHQVSKALHCLQFHRETRSFG